ncbi:MAG: hypothetical protein R6T96_10745 [Longimicrobiales bacterium]
MTYIASRSRQVVLIVAGVLGGLVIDYAVLVPQGHKNASTY